MAGNASSHPWWRIPFGILPHLVIAASAGHGK
jgi:hypothetical protein